MNEFLNHFHACKRLRYIIYKTFSTMNGTEQLCLVNIQRQINSVNSTSQLPSKLYDYVYRPNYVTDGRTFWKTPQRKLLQFWIFIRCRQPYICVCLTLPTCLRWQIQLEQYVDFMCVACLHDMRLTYDRSPRLILVSDQNEAKKIDDIVRLVGLPLITVGWMSVVKTYSLTIDVTIEFRFAENFSKLL